MSMSVKSKASKTYTKVANVSLNRGGEEERGREREREREGRELANADNVLLKPW